MSFVTWHNEIYIESTCLLFCFDGWALTLLFVLTPCRFLHFRKYILHRGLMGNFLNNGPTILKLIVRVRIYHILNKHLEKKLFYRFIEVKRTSRHDTADILLKVALNTKNKKINQSNGL